DSAPRLRLGRTRTRYSHFTHARNPETLRIRQGAFLQPAQFLSVAGRSDGRLPRLLQIFFALPEGTRARSKTNFSDDRLRATTRRGLRRASSRRSAHESDHGRIDRSRQKWPAVFA